MLWTFFVKRFNFESDHIPTFSRLEIESDIKNLADIDDEDALISHIESQKHLIGPSELRPEVKTEIVEDTSNFPGNDIMSKYFNSLPKNDEFYYQQMDKQLELVTEAQEKVKLEAKLHGLVLDENNENVEEEDNVPELIDTAQLPPLNDQFDSASIHSNAMSTASTISPHEVKSRLLREYKKREIRQKMKVNPKNIKGDANALRRKKKNDQALANEDLKGYLDSFL